MQSEEESQCGCEGILVQDQSPDESFEAVAKILSSDKNAPADRLLGFGMFSVPDPEAGPLASKTVFVDKISYEECCRRGHLCRVFKWIHPDVMSLADVQARRAMLGVCYDSRRCQRSNECRIFCYCNGNKKCVQDI